MRALMGVQLQQVSLAYESRAVLEGISWQIQAGQRWVLAGGNGAGKTQLLKLIAGDVWPSPDANAQRIYHWQGQHLDQPMLAKEHITYLGPERQDRYERYDWNFTAAAVVGTGLYRSDIPLDRLTAADRLQIRRLLTQLHIVHLARRRFLTLSYGERRLVLLARALATRPALLLLDEVCSGLDTDHRQRLLQRLDAGVCSRLPWVYTTHHALDIPRSATHLAVLRDGQLQQAGKLTAAALRRAFAVTAAAPAAAATVKRRLTAKPHSTAHSEPLLQLRKACVYAEGTRLLRDISFTVEAGQCWVVHGGNGAGKSTLLRTLYGDHPVAVGGSITRAGIEPGVPLAEFRQWTSLIAPQLQTDHGQYETVLDVVGSGLHASIGLNESLTDAERRRARTALRDLGLQGFATRNLRQLSYGQLRRVLFARALVNKPRLLLLDEPYAGVDTPTRADLMRRIDAHLAAGGAVVIATHYRAEWPLATTHQLELAGGRPVRQTHDL